MLVDLMTPEGEKLRESGKRPWQVYPRPQMRRSSYVNLNGTWEFEAADYFPLFYSKKIQVPFCPESQLSGLKTHFPEGIHLYYRRIFHLPGDFCQDRVLLHIGAADQKCEIYVNQKRVGMHQGGYEAICVDITDALQAENELVIRCTDDLRDRSFPYGKQVLPEKRGGMWYTPVSGIWQSVWLESVPENYIHKLNIENRGYSVMISTEPPMDGWVMVPELGEFHLRDGSVTITPENPHLWSPENPYLYDFVVETEEDRVESYFAIRSLEIKEEDGYQRLCLNGKPYFFHGLLDQGYWPDGILTPAAPECYQRDILAMKELGFNTLRKHIKVEPEEFYYQCDRLGMVVFQDMVNNGSYSFLRDIALPTVGFQKLADRNMHRNRATRKAFLEGMGSTVQQLKNHPSICYWTVFNEGWGQFDSDNVYEVIKSLDDTRFVDSTSGWFRRKKTDVDSRHVYFKPIKLKAREKPLVLSEFGGYTYKPEGHVFNEDKSYGYGACETKEALQDKVEKLYLEQVVPAYHKGLCAAIYTQVSDVEDEINGLMSYDRKIVKLDAKRMRAIAEQLK